MRSITIQNGTTDIGELAPEITVQSCDGAFWINQLHNSHDGLRASMVGMSRVQAEQVRNALSELLDS